MNNKFVYGAIAVTFIVAVLALVVGVGSHPAKLGGAITTNLPSLGVADFSVGSNCGDGYTSCNGTDLTGLIGTTCNLIGSNASQTASSTKAYDCAVTNLTSSFNVIAQLATTTITGAFSGGWVIASSQASTTAGFATVFLTNLSGAAAIPSVTAVGSSTKIWAFK